MEEREPPGPADDDENEDESPGEAVIVADDTGMLAGQQFVNETEERPQ
ncbi:MAG: hypothetical protein ABR508_06335 [Candidatus Baltobacteraceae bacterium]